MNKRTKLICSLCAVLAAAFAAVLAWGLTQRARAEEYFEAAGEYMETAHSVYERCAGELADNVNDMQNELARLRAANSERQTVLALEDIVRSGAAAASIMSRLPRTHEATEKLMIFLVRAGDYARSLSRRVLSGERLSGRDLDQLESLFTCCSNLASDLQAAVQGGGLSLDVLAPSGYYADGSDPTGLLAVHDERISSSDEGEPEYPSLIYDGPFSESAEKAVPRGLTGGDVTAAEALLTVNALTGAILSPQGVSGGKLPCYLFGDETADGSHIGAAVTVRGGRLLWYMSGVGNEASADLPELTGGYADGPDSRPQDGGEFEREVSAALDFMNACGYTDMTPTYVVRSGGTALISFVWQSGGIKAYNDLIKVWVDRNDMRVIGLDANNYLFSHRQRSLPNAVLTSDEAMALASDRLDIDAASLALIPLTPSVEALCWELHGFIGDEGYAVYINAITGAEEQIFRLLSDGAV